MSYENFYNSFVCAFQTSRRAEILRKLDVILVWLFIIAYALLIIWLAFNKDGRLLRALIVPAFTFCFISCLRSLINRPRPFETYSFSPVISQVTQKKSMPSRHVGCASIIAATFFWIMPPLGLIGLFATFLIALTRLLGGVHYLSDILVAIALSAVIAHVGYIVL